MPPPKIDARDRLLEESKAWARSHPQGFIAKPQRGGDNTDDLLTWDCVIPGRTKTPWEGGLFKLRLEFPEDYPYNPPRCIFDPPIFHPNVYPSGVIALSLLDKESWKPETTLKEVLLGIQILLDDPNFDEPAQVEAFVVHSQGKFLYEERVREQAQRMRTVRKPCGIELFFRPAGHAMPRGVLAVWAPFTRDFVHRTKCSLWIREKSLLLKVCRCPIYLEISVSRRLGHILTCLKGSRNLYKNEHRKAYIEGFL